MKLFSMILLTFLFAKGCDSEAQNNIENAVVEYTANTRGFYQKIVVQNQTFSVTKLRNGLDKPMVTKINDTDWKTIVTLFKTIKLDSLPNLKAPTDKRFYDGAAIANLKVIYKEKTYESAPFDHGTPPAAIEKLVNKINSLVKKEQ